MSNWDATALCKYEYKTPNLIHVDENVLADILHIQILINKINVAKGYLCMLRMEI